MRREENLGTSGRPLQHEPSGQEDPKQPEMRHTQDPANRAGPVPEGPAGRI
jgi:hypothetical protein